MNKFQKARSLHNLGMVAVDKRTPNGKVKTAFVSGSKAKVYHTILRRYPGRITIECRLDTGATGYINCASNGYVCKHGLATILEALAEAGMSAAMCKDEKIARNLSNMGGDIIEVSKWKGDQINYLVVKNGSK